MDSEGTECRNEVGIIPIRSVKPYLGPTSQTPVVVFRRCCIGDIESLACVCARTLRTQLPAHPSTTSNRPVAGQARVVVRVDRDNGLPSFSNRLHTSFR